MMQQNVRISVLTSLYNCKRYLSGYFEHLARVLNLEEIEVLLLHNEPKEDEVRLIEKAIPRFPQHLIQHIEIDQRESLYASWNRGVRHAQGAFIGVWNVDDIREPNSLQKQADLLTQNPHAGMAYGDMIGVDNYGDKEGRLYTAPEFAGKQNLFLRNFYGSCFPMWPKQIHEKVGYFDEQLRVVGDLDFQIRIASQSEMVKVDSLLGYYLEGDPNKLTRSSNLIVVEGVAIGLRYGIGERVNVLFLPETLTKIKIKSLFWYGKNELVSSWYKGHRLGIMEYVSFLSKCMIRLPLDVARALKHCAKSMFHF